MPRKKKEESVADMEQVLTDKQLELFSQIDDETRSKLSQVLFPDTHTDIVEVLGKSRTLRPLPIKHARIIQSKLAPLRDLIEKAATSPESVPLDEPMLNGLFDVARTMAEFYKWDDVEQAASPEVEALTVGELQALAITQSELNGANDFLLGTLRSAIQMMRITEILLLKFQSISISPPSQRSGTVPTMSLSLDTPLPNSQS